MKLYILKINTIFRVKNLINSVVFRLDFLLKNKIRNTRNSLTLKGKISNVLLDVVGANNVIIIDKGAYVSNCRFYIKGNNNKIFINKGVVVYSGELWIEDCCNEIFIDSNTSIQKAHIAVTEKNKKIHIGKDCMLSTDIEIRTGDSHSIMDLNTNQRINHAADVVIQDHVWIGSKVSVLKGVVIGEGSIIGTGSIVTKSIPNNCLAAGVPAKIIKKDVAWLRERV